MPNSSNSVSSSWLSHFSLNSFRSSWLGRSPSPGLALLTLFLLHWQSIELSSALVCYFKHLLSLLIFTSWLLLLEELVHLSSASISSDVCSVVCYWWCYYELTSSLILPGPSSFMGSALEHLQLSLSLCDFNHLECGQCLTGQLPGDLASTDILDQSLYETIGQCQSYLVSTCSL